MKQIKLRKRDIAAMIVSLFDEYPDTTLDLKTIWSKLRLTSHPARINCVDALRDMVYDDYLAEPERMHFRLAHQMQVMEGTFRRKSNGKNVFVPADGGAPILVAERNSRHALDGDTVRATLLARRKHHIREAEVIEIVSRAVHKVIGTVRVSHRLAWIKTDDKEMPVDILLPSQRGVKDGDKVVARIVDWPDDSRNPIGALIDNLGPTGQNDTEMHAILQAYGLPYTYPRAVEDAADAIPDEISATEIAAREDMRGDITFTIDPRDAKDFDAALSIMPISSDLWRVGVHIADVSHYVTEGSVIDREAQKRATSVYLVDRTIPMLPERLCNKICSLRPDEDKLTYSVVFEMNAKAEVKSWHLAHTVTRSDRRFTYEEVQALLEAHGEASPEDLGKPGDHTGPTYEGAPDAELFADQLITLNRMAKQLRARRFEHGAVNFDRAEARFEIDAEGHPTAVYFKVAKDANKLVEEFMLLANRTVAESIGRVPKGKQGKVLPYRIHDKPDDQKLLNLSDMAARFGHHLYIGGGKTPTRHKMGETNRQLNRLMADIEGRPESNLLQLLTLKAMAKAKYSTINIGHYGLAFEFYTHFTSPIRRYPDLMVHRLLTRYAEGARSASKQKYEELCEHSSIMEQTAAQAERDSIKYKQVEFMAGRIGEEYDGMISGVTEWGLYVELDDNKCEGLVPIHSLEGDYYEMDEKTFSLIGRRCHHRYTLGDKVRVRVEEANLERRQMRFAIVRRPTNKA